MPVDPKTLEQYNNKQVILHVIQDDGSVKELEGKVEAASEFGIAFKEKGKRDSDLVEPDSVEEVQLAPSKPKKILQKKLKEVEERNVRQHLVDRHGLTRSEVNELTDEDALARHDEIDHDDLGHRHVSDDDDDDNDSEGSDSEE